jgi:hypothetical protein
VAGALAVAVPAIAKQPPHPSHPQHPNNGNGNTTTTSTTTTSTGTSTSTTDTGDGHGRGHGNGRGDENHPAGSEKCTAHDVAYIASGTEVSFSATQNSSGGYDGTIVVHVTRTNHHAASDQGTDVTYTLSSAIVRFGKGTSASDTGDRAKVIGEVTTLAKKCDQTGFTPTVTVDRVSIRRPPGTH